MSSFQDALSERGEVLGLGDGRACVLVRDVRNHGHAVLAAEKLARTADEHFGSAGLVVKPALSLGVAVWPSHAQEAHRMLQMAQIASEGARARKVRVSVFDTGCYEEVVRPWSLSSDFARALDMGELSVYYQPKMLIATELPAGVESLMRWFRDGQTVASPDVFIPLATEAGLIAPATWYSLSNSLRTSKELGDLPVAVNITPEMLHHRDFLDMVRAGVSTWAAQPRALTLEVTEGALIADIDAATQKLNKVRDMGIRVSIDDFGTGYSSLSYFKKIPADELKIDKSFVKKMTSDESDRKLVRTIIDLARHFGLKTVAEGVEDRSTLQSLADLQCDYAQGYLYSPALERSVLEQWLAVYPSEGAV